MRWTVTKAFLMFFFFSIFVVLLDVGESGWEHSSAHSAYATFQPKWNKVK